MLKNQNPILISVLVVLIVGVASYLLISFLILPSFTSWTESQTKLDQQKQRVEQIKSSVESLKGLNQRKIEEIRNFVDILIPDQFDSFHFAALNEIVSSAAGVSITSVSVIKGVGGQTTAVGKGQTNQSSASSATVSYTSDFDSILRLIRYWKAADRLVGPSSISINGQAGSGQLNYTIAYQLPVASITPPATVEDKIVFTASQSNQLEKLRSTILYTATPSANPVGKDNPFR